MRLTGTDRRHVAAVCEHMAAQIEAKVIKTGVTSVYILQPEAIDLIETLLDKLVPTWRSNPYQHRSKQRPRPTPTTSCGCGSWLAVATGCRFTRWTPRSGVKRLRSASNERSRRRNVAGSHLDRYGRNHHRVRLHLHHGSLGIGREA